jgi:putative oxidoreductase
MGQELGEQLLIAGQLVAQGAAHREVVGQGIAQRTGRIGLGAISVVHGYQKLAQWGIDGTSATFGQMGLPAPTLSAWYSAVVELVGGAALVIGFALPVAGVLLALDMAGALVFVHVSHGFFAASNGYELVLALAVASLAIGFNGGAFALDRMLFRNRTRTQEPVAV